MVSYAKEVLLMAQAVQVPSAEGERAEVLVDRVEQTPRGRDSQSHVGGLGLFGVMRGFHLFELLGVCLLCLPTV